MSNLGCEGWWEQEHFGRQAMQQLRVQVDRGHILGSGVDVVGKFTLVGSLDRGQVTISKRYVGRHTVRYAGNYDGEGTMHGIWQAGSFKGPWAIRFPRSLPGDSEIQEWSGPP